MIKGESFCVNRFFLNQIFIHVCDDEIKLVLSFLGILYYLYHEVLKYCVPYYKVEENVIDFTEKESCKLFVHDFAFLSRLSALYSRSKQHLDVN